MSAISTTISTSMPTQAPGLKIVEAIPTHLHKVACMNQAPRCSARRRAGGSCASPAVRGGRAAGCTVRGRGLPRVRPMGHGVMAAGETKLRIFGARCLGFFGL
jgi:hypothetical protein